jgi:hypothetical protein
MKILFIIFLLCVTANAYAKNKARIRIDTTPTVEEGAITVTTEIDAYNGLVYINPSVDYSAVGGWDMQITSLNIPVRGSSAQNYQADTYINLSKTWTFSHDVTFTTGTQNGMVIFNAGSQWHNADYYLVGHQYNSWLQYHSGHYWVNKAFSTTTDVLGVTAGIVLTPNRKIRSDTEWFSGNNNLSGLTTTFAYKLTPQVSVIIGASLPLAAGGSLNTISSIAVAF